MREARTHDACPSGETLTALVHGEGAPEARAQLLRHVLACAVCRPEHAANERMLLALRGLGAARASAAPRDVPVRAAPRFAFLLPVGAAAAVLAVVFAAFHRGARRPEDARAPTVAAVAAVDPASRDLVAAQRPDGRWLAEPGLAGPGGDEAATGLVVLALLKPGREALTIPGVTRAVASATGWLHGRAAALADGASPADVRTRAVVAAALLKALDLTGDLSLRPATRSLLGSVADDAAASAGDPVSRPWIDYVLAQAEQAGWPGAGRDRRLLESAPPAVSPRAASPRRPAPVETASAAKETPVHLALSALANEPPLLAWSRGPSR